MDYFWLFKFPEVELGSDSRDPWFWPDGEVSCSRSLWCWSAPCCCFEENETPQLWALCSSVVSCWHGANSNAEKVPSQLKAPEVFWDFENGANEIQSEVHRIKTQQQRVDMETSLYYRWLIWLIWWLNIWIHKLTLRDDTVSYGFTCFYVADPATSPAPEFWGPYFPLRAACLFSHRKNKYF